MKIFIYGQQEWNTGITSITTQICVIYVSWYILQSEYVIYMYLILKLNGYDKYTYKDWHY